MRHALRKIILLAGFTAFCPLVFLPAGPVHAAPPLDLPDEVAAPRPDSEAKGEERSKTFDAQSFTLDNGLEVIVVENHRAPVVTHMVWYKTGASQEPQGKSGIAHFLEHLMFKGSAQIGGPDLAPGEFSRIIRGLGGQDNAFTSQDYTAYYQSVPADALETVMRMEAGRMRGMILTPEVIDAERSVIMEERRQRTDNNPQSRFIEQLNKHVFPAHPYGIPVIGWMDEIEALGLEDALEYYRRWYTPNNAVLIVAGDVSPAKVYAKAIDIYGPIPRHELPPENYSATPGLGEGERKTRLVEHDSAVREALVYQVFKAPSAVQDKQSALALDVMAEIMGGGPTSRLYQSLVTRQKIASSAGMSYDGMRRGEGTVSLYGVPLPNIKPEKIEQALKKEMNLLAEKGVSAQELENAITRLQDNAIYARDSLSGPAMVIGRAMASGLSLEDVEYWPHEIASVTREDVQRAAQSYLSGESVEPVTGVLLPAPANDNAEPETKALETKAPEPEPVPSAPEAEPQEAEQEETPEADEVDETGAEISEEIEADADTDAKNTEAE